MSPRSLFIGLGLLVAAGLGGETARAGEGTFHLHRGDLVVHATFHSGPRRAVLYRRVRRVRVRRCRYVPGHHEVRETRTWIPGFYREESLPAEYQLFVDRYGRTHRVLIRPSCTRRIWVPGHWEIRRESVWIPGHYVS